MSNNYKGFLSGILSSATFGLIPLFALPLMAVGMRADSILFYRFLVAAVILGVMLKVRGESFALKFREVKMLVLLAGMYVVSSQFLLMGYDYMASGVAITIHFLYPVLVALIMIAFSHERRSLLLAIAIVLAFSGVALLSGIGSDNSVSLWAIFIVFLSSLGYATYIVCLNKSNVRGMDGQKITFYVLTFGAVIFLINSQFLGGVQVVPDAVSWFNVAMLAVIPTIVSNLALVKAVKYIGSTMTSILGAMEPVTAVCVGVLVFGEEFSVKVAGGITMIVAAVTLVILARPIESGFRYLRYFYIVLKRHRRAGNKKLV